MIRFINLRSQYFAEDSNKSEHFAFIDTVVNHFVKCYGEQYWNSKKDFTECFNIDPWREMDLKRFTEKIPKYLFNIDKY